MRHQAALAALLVLLAGCQGKPVVTAAQTTGESEIPRGLLALGALDDAPILGWVNWTGAQIGEAGKDQPNPSTPSWAYRGTRLSQNEWLQPVHAHEFIETRTSLNGDLTRFTRHYDASNGLFMWQETGPSPILRYYQQHVGFGPFEDVRDAALFSVMVTAQLTAADAIVNIGPYRLSLIPTQDSLHPFVGCDLREVRIEPLPVDEGRLQYCLAEGPLRAAGVAYRLNGTTSWFMEASSVLPEFVGTRDPFPAYETTPWRVMQVYPGVRVSVPPTGDYPAPVAGAVEVQRLSPTFATFVMGREGLHLQEASWYSPAPWDSLARDVPAPAVRSVHVLITDGDQTYENRAYYTDSDSESQAQAGFPAHYATVGSSFFPPARLENLPTSLVTLRTVTDAYGELTPQTNHRDNAFLSHFWFTIGSPEALKSPGRAVWITLDACYVYVNDQFVQQPSVAYVVASAVNGQMVAQGITDGCGWGYSAGAD